VEGVFCEVGLLLYGVLGSSARRRSQISLIWGMRLLPDLATVVALYYAAGLPLVPLLCGRRMEEVSARTRLFAYLGVAIGVIAGLYFDWPF
jgi:hypothetical protein